MRERAIVYGQEKKKVGAQCMFEMTERRANSESCMFFVVVGIVVVVVVVVLYSV